MAEQSLTDDTASNTSAGHHHDIFQPDNEVMTESLKENVTGEHG